MRRTIWMEFRCENDGLLHSPFRFRVPRIGRSLLAMAVLRRISLLHVRSTCVWFAPPVRMRRIGSIDTSAARATPGIVTVWTAAELG